MLVEPSKPNIFIMLLAYKWFCLFCILFLLLLPYALGIRSNWHRGGYLPLYPLLGNSGKDNILFSYTRQVFDCVRVG